MENTIITLTAEELTQQKNTRNIISALKEQLVNHMIVKKAINNSKDGDDITELVEKYSYKFEGDYITLIHIIHNRLRRGNKRPHLGTIERDNEFIANNKFEVSKIIEFVKQKGFDVEELSKI